MVAVVQVSDEDELMLVTDRGRLIRLRVEDIRVVGRNTQGVKLIEIDDGERLVSLARVDESPELGDAPEAAESPESTEPPAN